jgi:uric acid-xanthine permease
LVATNTTLPPPYPTCTNGETSLGYGSPEYIGLGFSVMAMLVFIELFGSVFFKNCNVFLALIFGYFVAAVSNYNGMSYVTNQNFVIADPITFLWVETFPLGFYGPAVIPLLIAFLVTAGTSTVALSEILIVPSFINFFLFPW